MMVCDSITFRSFSLKNDQRFSLSSHVTFFALSFVCSNRMRAPASAQVPTITVHARQGGSDAADGGRSLRSTVDDQGAREASRASCRCTRANVMPALFTDCHFHGTRRVFVACVSGSRFELPYRVASRSGAWASFDCRATSRNGRESGAR